MVRIAVYLAKFDPITKSQMNYALNLISQNYDHIYLVPIHSENDFSYNRYRMCEIAVASADQNEKISVLEITKSSAKKEMQEITSLIKTLHPESNIDFISEKEKYIKEGFGSVYKGTESNASVKKIKAFNDPEEIDRNVLVYIASKGLYLNCNEKNLKEILSKTRFQHTMGVRTTAVELAKRFDGQLIKSSVAAFYHDCAKEMSAKDMKKICTGPMGLAENDEMLVSGALMHGPVGAFITEKEYGIKDHDILNAIRYHTTGRVGMSQTEKIVFLADAIEPNRGEYPGLAETRQLAQVSLNAAMLFEMCITKAYVMKSGKTYHSSGDATIQWLYGICTDHEKDLVRNMLKRIM